MRVKKFMNEWWNEEMGKGYRWIPIIKYYLGT